MGALSFNWNFKNSFQYLLDPTVTCHFSIPLTFRETGLGSPALHYVSYLSWPQPFFSSLHTSSLSELFWCKIYTLGVSTKHLTSQCHVSLVFFLKVFDLHCTVNSILLVFCWQLALKLAFPLPLLPSPGHPNPTHTLPGSSESPDLSSHWDTLVAASPWSSTNAPSLFFCLWKSGE